MASSLLNCKMVALDEVPFKVLASYWTPDSLTLELCTCFFLRVLSPAALVSKLAFEALLTYL